MAEQNQLRRELSEALDERADVEARLLLDELKQNLKTDQLLTRIANLHLILDTVSLLGEYEYDEEDDE